MNLNVFIYALLGGILPALVWLLFWLREDRRNPEPDGLILRTFFFGMLSVILVLPFQKGIDILLPGFVTLPIILWAMLEEIFKFFAGYFGGLHSKEDNEPIDPMIYMITAALGFVALENTLFILGPLLQQDIPQTLLTGNLRFIGASLLHVIASGFVGALLSFAFYKSLKKKVKAVFLGLLGAILIHIVFNLLIVSKGELGATIAFSGVWLAIIVLLLTFERVKGIAPKP
jgi:RsiW-degrading membrane proteinase PrsW (M82 family)